MSDAPSQAQEHDRPATVSTGEYSIGSNVLPGLSKLVEAVAKRRGWNIYGL